MDIGPLTPRNQIRSAAAENRHAEGATGNMRKYRVAVIGGAGTWGSRYLRAYANHPSCEIVALVDRAKDRRDAFADRYGIETVFDTLDDLLAREVPDIVSAILPTSHNPDAVIACAEVGVKVVSCEKPIAVELSQADAMVRICRERGTVFSCGSVYSGVPYLLETIDWIRAGNLGRLTAAAIPSGLPREVSGGGCVQLTLLRLLTGMEVEWVEGWTLPPESDWMPPVDISTLEIDCPAYGRLGLSGDIICEIPMPTEQSGPCPIAVTGEDGQVWMNSPKPVFIQGRGAASTPIYPNFFDTGQDVLDSGHGYRQALEVAIALKQSARCGHRQISLPLADRSLRIVPHPYRLLGGDMAGWESIGYTGPPNVE